MDAKINIRIFLSFFAYNVRSREIEIQKGNLRTLADFRNGNKIEIKQNQLLQKLHFNFKCTAF